MRELKKYRRHRNKNGINAEMSSNGRAFLLKQRLSLKFRKRVYVPPALKVGKLRVFPFSKSVYNTLNKEANKNV